MHFRPDLTAAPHVRADLGLGRTFQGTGVAEDLTVEENVESGSRWPGSAGPTR